MAATCDAIIIGGGAMGSATAYHLAGFDSELEVTVVEKDPTYEFCSTVRSDGNVRVQFNLEENILMSLYTMELLDTLAGDMEVGGRRPDPAPRRQGNLFLAQADGRAAAEKGLATQRSLGCEVGWLDPDEIAVRWPAYRSDRIAGATFGPKDGTVDPQAIMHAFRRGAMARGVAFRHAEVSGFVVENGSAAGVRLSGGEEIHAPVIVACAGAWTTDLARSAGIELPVTPVMRTVYTVETRIAAARLPCAFTPNGAYLIPEGGHAFVMAWSQTSDPIGFDFTFSRAQFEERVWPEIVETFPAFDSLVVTGGWTGLYAVNTLDGNAILGEWPGVSGLYVATGFSGHGFQHTPAMGRYLAELITGREPALDLSRLGPQRILTGTPLYEHEGRII